MELPPRQQSRESLHFPRSFYIRFAKFTLLAVAIADFASQWAV
jgi:hypothetical protein